MGFAKKVSAVVLPAGAIALGLVAAQGLESAQGIIKYRKSVMKSQAGHIGAIGAIAKGQVPFKQDLVAHAVALRSTSKMILEAFPEGSGTGDTRARPEIWTEWIKFEQAARNFEKESEKLVQVAKSGDLEQVSSQFLAVAKACKGCHKPFRKKKKK
ncbi:MAG: c-type cytochrome [Candidatus Methylomirabilales bacterium]